MSKAIDEEVIIPKDILEVEIQKRCKNTNVWTCKEVNALKQLFNKDGVILVSHKKATELVNRYARDPALPPRTEGQIRNKIEALRTTGVIPRMKKQNS